MVAAPEMRAPRRSSCGEAFMGGTEPVCRAHRRRNDAGSSRSIGSAGATWRRCHCAFMAEAAEPPAHCRLVSGPDLARWGPGSVVPAHKPRIVVEAGDCWRPVESQVCKLRY